MPTDPSPSGSPDGVLARLADRLAPAADAAANPAVTVGDRQVLVALDAADERSAGVAHRPDGAPTAAADRPVAELLDRAVDPAATALDRAIGLATMNALSAPRMDWRWGDPMAALDGDVRRVATVGLFRPALRKFADVDVRVIEREPAAIDPATIDAPAGVRVSLVGPDRPAAALSGADVVFVTGSTLIYGGLDAYLAAVPRSATIVLVGATASFVPAPAFAAGVDVVAGVAVVDIDAARAGIVGGECGTSLHDAGLRKGYVARGPISGLALEPTASNRDDDHVNDHDQDTAHRPTNATPTDDVA